MPISNSTRKTLKRILQNDRQGNEIADSLGAFVDRFITFSGTYSDTAYHTIYEYDIPDNTTVLLVMSVIGKENSSTNRAGFRRTGTFYRDTGSAQQVDIPQTDYTQESLQAFDAKFVISGNKVQVQVRNANAVSTKWSGSVEKEILT